MRRKENSNIGRLQTIELSLARIGHGISLHNTDRRI